MLAASLFLGWYTVSATSQNVNVTQTFYAWSVQTTNTLGGSTPASFTASYAGAYLSHTGALYGVAVVLLLVTIASVILAVVGRSRTQRGRGRRKIVAVVILASLLASSLPLLFALAQPTVACQDAKNFPPSLGQPGNNRGAASPCSWEFYLGGGTWSSPGSGPGPGQSFFGQRSVGSSSEVWGPSIGWFLAVGSAAVLSLGAALEWRDLRLANRPSVVTGAHRGQVIDRAGRR